MRIIANALAKRIATKEGYKKKAVENYGSPAYSSGLVSVISFVLMAATILAIVDIVQVKKLSPLILLILLVLCYIPFIGDIIGISILVYWLLYIRPDSILINSMSPNNALVGVSYDNLFKK